MRLYLVRHGETVWNIESRFQGWSDLPLSAIGEAQARELARRIAGVHFDAAYSSDLTRAVGTAEILLAGRSLAPVQIDALREMHLGELDGLTEEEVQRLHHDVVTAWRTDPTEVVMPGGESIRQVQERAWRAVDKIRAKHQGETVLVVGHHTANKTILCRLLGIPLKKARILRQPPCSLSVVDFLPDREFVHAVNLNWRERTSIWLDVDEAVRHRIARVEAVVFDLDGVLLDSMPYYAAAWRFALAEHGLVPDEAEFYRRESEDADLSVRFFFQEAGKKVEARTVADIAARVGELYRSFNGISPRQGAFEVCGKLKSGGKLLSLVTGSPKEEIQQFLTPGQLDLFDVVVTRDDVQRGKPDPEPFLLALKKLDKEPEEALVVENAPFGIRAARAAGIVTAALTSTLPPEELREADFIIDTLERLPAWLGIE